MIYRKLLVCMLLFVSENALGQYIISPVDRAIYQRSNENKGIIPVKISGLQGLSDKELTVRKVDSNQVIIHQFRLNNQSTQLDTNLICPGGWFELELTFRRSNGDQVKLSNKTGVGEVFLVAGQSNAVYEGPSATDERVIGAYYSLDPTFISITDDNEYRKWLYPSPPGTSFLGVLGDSLVKKLDVPVLFFNAGAGGTNSYEWWKSAVQDTLPYAKMDWVIYQFLVHHGVRGVLWHQGESNSLTFAQRISSEEYFDHLSYVIEKTRRNLNYKDLSWMVALVSWSKESTTSESNDPNTIAIREQTRNGQLMLTQRVSEVYLGPDSDLIEGYKNSENRPDGVHFSYKGEALLADLWYKKMMEGYFQLSKPLLSIKFEQSVSIIEGLLADCSWQKIGIHLNSGQIPDYRLLSGPAEISGDSIRLKGAGPVVISVSHPGNGSYQSMPADTVSLWADPFLEDAQAEFSCGYFFENEAVKLQAHCKRGEVVWYNDPSGITNLQKGNALNLLFNENTDYFASCVLDGCRSRSLSRVRLIKKEVNNTQQPAFFKKVRFNDLQEGQIWDKIPYPLQAPTPGFSGIHGMDLLIEELNSTCNNP